MPGWFMEQIIPDGGVFYVPQRDAGVFDNVDWPIEDGMDQTPNFAHRSPLAPERACFSCTNGWPYPNFCDTEDYYVEFLNSWRAEEKKADGEEGKD